MTVEERFWAKVRKSESCWEWTGATQHPGYGRFRLQGRTEYAHRLSWELTNGPIPEGMEVCHRCDNRPCVRPDHLFLGTQADNMADMDRKGRKWYRPRPQFCKRGHPFDEVNTYVNKRGWWQCKICQLEYKRSWRKAHAA